MNIVFIPVRGGSKSIPLKNIKLLHGKPLLYWSACAAENANSIDKIIVATDSMEIKTIAESFNFSKLTVYERDSENAQDTSSTESVILEYLQKTNYNDNDLLFLIQATSPLITSEDIDNMYNKFINNNFDSMFTGVREKQFHWIEDGENTVPINYDYRNRPRRQDFKGIIAENGACYINSIKNIKKDKCRLSGKIGTFELPSYTSYEIDEPNDWLIIESIMTNVSKYKH